jgi:alkylhydroperoxidase family enzyme
VSGPYIRLVDEEEADGPLKVEYDAAVERAGKVFNILKAMSLNPRVLRASMDLYKEIMFGESSLSRKERELLATVTSAEQFCRY